MPAPSVKPALTSRSASRRPRPDWPRLAVGYAVLLVCLAAGAHPSALAADPAARSADEPADRVLILLAEGFNTGEFWQPYYALKAAGYTVDIASMEAGPIQAGGKNRDLDTTANLALADVDPSRYVGLLIPGGYSPANLEKHQKALDITAWFMDHNQPVAAICHGPRVIGQAGRLDGRVATGLWKLADELPAMWNRGGMGTYVDEPVVIDGQLLTSRYPKDLVPFCTAMLTKFHANGGLPPALHDSPRQLIVIDPATDGRSGDAFIWGGMRSQGAQVTRLRNWAIPAWLESHAKAEANVAHAMLVVPGRELDKLADDENFAKLVQLHAEAGRPVYAFGEAAEVIEPMVASAGGQVHDSDDASRVAFARKLLADLEKMPPAEQTLDADAADEPAYPDAVIALHPGFDERVAIGMEATLRAHGLEVQFVAPERGLVRGLSGLPLTVTRTYQSISWSEAADSPDPRLKGMLVIAPGGLWPSVVQTEADADNQKSAKAPALQTDTTRTAWLRAAHDHGAKLVTFGFDSWRIGTDPAFADLDFASSDQTVWSWRIRDAEGNRIPAGNYSDKPVEQTTDRLISASGYEALPKVIELLELEP